MIDTPGFVSGSAACALWWEVVRIIRPKGIIAVERGNELSDIIQGLKHSGPVIEEIKCSESVSQKSPEHRRAYRQQRFAEYFADAKVYETGLKEISVQAGRRLDGDNTKGLLVGLRDNKGIDIAMGFVVEWHEGDKVIFKSPEINLNQICCIVVGDATVDLPE